MKRVLAVGERFNAPTWRPALLEHEHSFELRVKMGLYNDGHRREFLRELGVDWDDGVNLLWPDPQGAPWCAAEARRVANAISSRVLAYRYVLLFGQHVCAAFGVPWRPCEFVPASNMGAAMIGYRTEFVPLPHPSGLNRLWNDHDVRALVQRTMVLMREEVAR